MTAATGVAKVRYVQDTDDCDDVWVDLDLPDKPAIHVWAGEGENLDAEVVKAITDFGWEISGPWTQSAYVPLMFTEWQVIIAKTKQKARR